MTAATKNALIDFAKATQDLAAGTVHVLGVNTAANVLSAAHHLIHALNQEPTIEINLCTSPHSNSPTSSPAPTSDAESS